MTRRRALDWLLVALLTASWGGLFARAIRDGIRTERGRPWVAVSSAATAEDYPKATGWPRYRVVPGDEVTAVDGESVRGYSALRVYDLATRAARERGRTEIRLSRAGSPFTVSVGLTPMPYWWLFLVYSAGMFLAGLTLLLRAPEWHLARRNFLACWCFAIPPVSGNLYGSVGTAADVTLALIAYALGSVLAVWNAQEFTLSARPVPLWHRALALPAGILFLVLYAGRYLLPSTWATTTFALFAAVTSLAAAEIAALIRAYLRAGPLERRQLRWVVFGFQVALVGAVLAVVAGIVQARAGDTGGAAARVLQSLSGLGVPVGIAISVIGYRWLDIDRLISAAASYTIVGIVVLGAALAVVPRVASEAAAAFDLDPVVAQWLLTLGLVVAAVPAHLYLRPRLDRRMFAERHRRVSGLEQLADEVGRCAGAEELWKLTSERIDALLEPESLVVYAREGQIFQTRFARGLASPPPYPADSLLVQALERRGLPLAVDSGELEPFDRAALDTLGVALVMPIGTHDSLLAFACLGRKRSRDIYTRDETAQLAAIAWRCAQVLRPRSEPAAALPNVFRREGELWTLSSGGKQIQLRDMRGLQYLAILLREPGREFAAVDLVRAGSGLASRKDAAHEPDLAVVHRLGDAGPVLDARARAEYRARVTALDAELADAERCADLGRLGRLRDEREGLLAELDLAGRDRRSASHSERARVAVTKAIKAALEKIAERHPELGEHLTAAVRRGYLCAYEPDPRRLVEWEV